jgi:hypothetical protein
MPIIKQTRQYSFGPVGVVRASRAGQITGEAMAELGSTISQIAFKEAAINAEKVGTESANTLDEASISTIDPATGLPKAMDIPKGYGRIAAAAYERVVRARYENSIKTTIENKALILQQKYEPTSNPVGGFNNEFSGFLSGLTDQFGDNENSFKSTVLRFGKEVSSNSSTNLYMAKVDRDRAAAAAALTAQMEDWTRINIAKLSSSPNATKDYLNTKGLNNPTTANIADLAANGDVSGLNGKKGDSFVVDHNNNLDKVGVIGLFTNYATKLNATNAEILSNWLQSNGNIDTNTLPLEVRNVIADVAEATSINAVLKYAGDAQKVVTDVADQTKLYETTAVEEAAQSFDVATINIQNRTSFALNNPESKDLIAEDLLKTQNILSQAEAAVVSGKGFISPEKKIGLDKDFGDQIAQAYISLADTYLQEATFTRNGETISMSNFASFSEAMDAIGTRNVMGVLLGFDGLPKTEDKLPSAIQQAYLGLDSDGRDAFAARMGTYFTTLENKSDRLEKRNIITGKTNVVNGIGNFNPNRSTDLVSIASEYNSVLGKITQFYDPEGQASRTNDLNQALVGSVLGAIKTSSKDEILAVEEYLKNRKPLTINGREVILSADTKERLDTIHGLVGDAATKTSSFSTSVNSWREKQLSNESLNQERIADANDISQVNVESSANAYINQIGTSIGLGQASSYYNQAIDVINSLPDDTSERVDFKNNKLAEANNALAKLTLSSRLNGLNEQELKQVQRGIKPEGVSSEKFNLINEAAKNDSLTQENVDNVFSKAKTREIDRIAIREKALELERFSRSLQLGILTPTAENTKMFNDQFYKESGIDLRKSEDLIPLLKEIASGDPQSIWSKKLVLTLDQIVPEPLINAWNILASGQDPSQTLNISRGELTRLWGKFAHRIDANNQPTYSTALMFNDAIGADTRETMNTITRLEALGSTPERINTMILFKSQAKSNIADAITTQAKAAGFESMPLLIDNFLNDDDFNIYTSVLTLEDQLAISTDIAAQIFSGIPANQVLSDVKNRLNAKVIQDPVTISRIDGVKYTQTGITTLHATNQANNIVAKYADRKLRLFDPNYGVTTKTLLPDGKVPEDGSLWTQKPLLERMTDIIPDVAANLLFSQTFIDSSEPYFTAEQDGVMFMELPESTVAKPMYGFVKVDQFGNRDPIMLGNEILKFDPNSPEILDEIAMSQTVFGERSARERTFIQNLGSSISSAWWWLDPNPNERGW